MEKAEILFDWIEDTYGTQEELAKVLNLGVEMLFYLEEDTFDRREVQQVVAALRGITNGLRVYSNMLDIESSSAGHICHFEIRCKVSMEKS